MDIFVFKLYPKSQFFGNDRLIMSFLLLLEFCILTFVIRNKMFELRSLLYPMRIEIFTQLTRFQEEWVRKSRRTGKELDEWFNNTDDVNKLLLDL